MMRILNMNLGMKKDKQVNIEKTSFLKLNSINMSYRDTKKTTVNEFKKCFLLLLKNIWYNIRIISGCLSKKKTK